MPMWSDINLNQLEVDQRTYQDVQLTAMCLHYPRPELRLDPNGAAGQAVLTLKHIGNWWAQFTAGYDPYSLSLTTPWRLEIREGDDDAMKCRRVYSGPNVTALLASLSEARAAKAARSPVNEAEPSAPPDPFDGIIVPALPEEKAT